MTFDEKNFIEVSRFEDSRTGLLFIATKTDSPGIGYIAQLFVSVPEDFREKYEQDFGKPLPESGIICETTDSAISVGGEARSFFKRMDSKNFLIDASVKNQVINCILQYAGNTSTLRGSVAKNDLRYN